MSECSMRERSVESYLRKRVVGLGGVVEKLVPVTRGMPDRLVLLPGGRVYLVEVKRPRGGVVSPAQRLWHARAERLGVKVWVLWSREDVDYWCRLVSLPE